MSRRKPRVSIAKEFIGLWGFGPIMEWVARDEDNNIIVHKRTMVECRKECVRKGYLTKRSNNNKGGFKSVGGKC